MVHLVRRIGRQVDEADDALAYWSFTPEALALRLRCGVQGLSSAEAAARLVQYGSNTVEDAGPSSTVRLFLRQFTSPLVLILVFAAAVSLLLHQWIDAGIVLAIVFGSSLFGFAQEYRASSAVAALKKRLALTSRVLRDGREQVVPAAGVVPGDVVLLSAGNLVPADGLVIEESDFLVSEAGMTGESFPVEKHVGAIAAAAEIHERTNSVFLGSSVRSGTASILVARTGSGTAFGAIAGRLRARPDETDFSKGVRHFGYLLIRAMIVVVLFVLTVNLLLDRPVIETMLFAVALAVGLSPELLPAIVTVTLSAGARRMSAQGVIVRHLESIENLGSMDIFCTDKTGTLTEGVIVLSEALDAAGNHSGEVLRLAYINAALETGIDNPLDAAIMAAGKDAGLPLEGLSKVDEIPYDFIRRRLTIVVRGGRPGARDVLITKGAFEEVLGVCTAIDNGDGAVPLDGGRKEALMAIFRAKGEDGFRVLALATRDMDAGDAYSRDDEADLVFRGFLVLSDPAKPEAGRTIRDLGRLGISIKVISGDNRYVTRHLAQTVGLDVKAMLTGEEISALRDEALWNLAPRTDLFVEIDPQQKERIVRALQRSGHSVGYLGDGINDAPALQAADVGISVESAVDVARESADIVLLSRNLDVLRAGIEDGRRTFVNTLKYIQITTSANFGNMVSMALATPFLPFLPLAAKQILLNNFLSDLPSVSISADNVDSEDIVRPRRWDVREIRRYMIGFGLISSVFDLLTFVMLLLVFQAGKETFQTMWFTVSLLTELAVLFVLRTRRPFGRSRPGRTLLWSSVAVAGLAVCLPYLGDLVRPFGFVPLSAHEFAATIVIVICYAAATEFAKLRFFGHRGMRSNGS